MLPGNIYLHEWCFHLFLNVSDHIPVSWVASSGSSLGMTSDGDWFRVGPPTQPQGWAGQETPVKSMEGFEKPLEMA